MDFDWNMGCCSCFNPFPPSFYYTHTDEEIKQIKEEMYIGLKALIEELSELEENRTVREND